MSLCGQIGNVFWCFGKRQSVVNTNRCLLIAPRKSFDILALYKSDYYYYYYYSLNGSDLCDHKQTSYV